MNLVPLLFGLLCACSPLMVVNATAFQDCGSVTGSIMTVDVTNCTKPPCTFVRGNDYTIDINFKSNTNTRTVQNHVYGIIAKVPVPFHLPNEDGCQLGITCPVLNGTKLHESVTMPVKNDYPKISLYVRWEVKDDANNMFICFIFPVKLV